jgi:dephospho-CoA kinase
VTLVVGLTGGIGSGKSAVAAAFASHGAPVVDADDIAHELSSPGRTGHDAVVAAFGPRSSRRTARSTARTCASARSPTTRSARASRRRCTRRSAPRSRAASRHGARPYGILVVPLLLERGGVAGLVDRVLVVDAPEDEQVRRVVLRSRLDPAQVRAIMATQLTRAARLARADDVLDNSGPHEAIGPAVASSTRRTARWPPARGDARP